MSEIDWSEAGEDCIGAFSRKGSKERFFVKTKEACNFQNKPGFEGETQAGNGYHVFSEYWEWRDRPSAWSGDGLPPVGTVCEASVYGMSNWFECKVVIHHPKEPGVAGIHDLVGDALLWTDTFRPIRTPEQIAAEDRENKIREIEALIEKQMGSLNVRGLAVEIHSAVYSKVEP